MNKEIIDKTIAALRHNHFEAFFAQYSRSQCDIFPGYLPGTTGGDCFLGRFRNDEGYGRFE